MIIIGAGITGLTAGYTLQKAGQEVHILEASDAPGGNINSEQHGPYLLECGPNTLLLNDQIYGLLHELGLADSIKTASTGAKYRFVLRGGTYQRLPSGPGSFLFGGFFSFSEKWRIWKERGIRSITSGDESIDQFFRRRFGDTVADYAVGPFVSGVYAGDPHKLQIDLAFPDIVKHEAHHGSVIKGMMASRKKPQEHKGIFSLEGGLQALPNRLAEKLEGSIQYNSAVVAIRPASSGGWEVETAKGEVLVSEQVAVCVPAFVLAACIEAWVPEEAAILKKVYYPATAGVYTAYKKSEVSHPLNGFGALHNHVETSETLGTIFNSTVFPDRCPADEVLLTTFVGGARHPEKAGFAKADIGELACLDHARFLGVKGKPVFQHVVQWPRGIPQYDAQLPAAMEVADKLEAKGLIAAANWRGGISVPACIARGLAF
ncbi:MAG: protoporphyrinogen oxidase [Bacteroidia bacterium]